MLRTVALTIAMTVSAVLSNHASAQQDVLSGSPLTAQAVAAAFESIGVGTQVGTDDYGDPYVELSPGGGLRADFGNVIFWDCDSAGVCDSILMVAGYQPQRRPVYLDVINQWNVERRWVRAYVDSENYVIIDMDVSGYGGISNQALVTQVDRFVSSVAEFARFLQR